jgi:hypothetical protein
MIHPDGCVNMLGSLRIIELSSTQPVSELIRGKEPVRHTAELSHHSRAARLTPAQPLFGGRRRYTDASPYVVSCDKFFKSPERPCVAALGWLIGAGDLHRCQVGSHQQ